jgi:Major Facilitator Superfamily
MWLACGIWVKTLTGSDTAAALTFLCFSAPAVLAPPLGLLVDRVRRGPLLVGANLAGAAMLVPLLFVDGREDVWLIYVVMVLHGGLTMLIAPAQSALLVTLLPAELRTDANAALRTTQEGLRVLAPLAGAGLFGLLGGHAVALLDMATFVIAAALVASLRHTEARAQGAAGGIGAGFRFITATSQLRRLTVASAVATLAVGLGGSTMYAVIGLGLHRPPQFAGVTQMVQGIGAIAGGLSAAAAIRRLGEVRTTVAALVVFAAAPLLVAAPSLPVVLAGNAVAGAALPWIVIAIITLLQRLAPLRLQGRVYAAFEVCATGPQTAGLAAGATLLAVLDYRAILAAESVALLLAAALLSRARTPVDALTTAAVPSPDRPRPAARPGPPPTPPGPRHLPRPSARTARSAPDRRPPADHLRHAP